MDYEKKYKETLERAKERYSACSAPALLEYIFPELKESEDERIRKAILELVRQSSEVLDKQNQNNMIAWLEKQGEKTKEWSNEDEYLLKETIKHLEELIRIDKKHFSGNNVPYCKRDIDWLKSLKFKKQSEQSIDYEHADIPQKDFAPIEPKFKVGDWITSIDDEGKVSTQKIIDFWGDKVRLVDLDEYFTLYPKSELNNYHLWTIQDAKDGDLIYVSTETKGLQAIFHKFENGIIYFHCNLCGDFAQGGYELSSDVKSVNPLLKEHYQRFFQKMKEAGYKWDGEKKELWHKYL